MLYSQHCLLHTKHNTHGSLRYLNKLFIISYSREIRLAILQYTENQVFFCCMEWTCCNYLSPLVYILMLRSAPYLLRYLSDWVGYWFFYAFWQKHESIHLIVPSAKWLATLRFPNINYPPQKSYRFFCISLNKVTLNNRPLFYIKHIVTIQD